MIQDHGDHATVASTDQAKPAHGHYPAKPQSAEPAPRSLRDVCLAMRDKVDAFLAEEQDTPLLRSVQAQLRVSMGVVEEALAKYTCVLGLYCASTANGSLMIPSIDLTRFLFRTMGEKTVSPIAYTPRFGNSFSSNSTVP